MNQIKTDGTYAFDHLIPGATYNTHVEVSGYPNATSAHVTLKPGPPIRLDDFRLPIADQRVSGTVVDARGKPLEGVMVNCAADLPEDPHVRSQRRGLVSRDQPRRQVQPDESARGPIKLMVYRKQEGAYRAIKDIRYFDVSPGQTDIRIELPDANDRLRGVD